MCVCMWKGFSVYMRVCVFVNIEVSNGLSCYRYGCGDSIPRVDCLVGPGNAYVTAAKQMEYSPCLRVHPVRDPLRRRRRGDRDSLMPAGSWTK